MQIFSQNLRKILINKFRQTKIKAISRTVKVRKQESQKSCYKTSLRKNKIYHFPAEIMLICEDWFNQKALLVR